MKTDAVEALGKLAPMSMTDANAYVAEHGKVPMGWSTRLGHPGFNEIGRSWFYSSELGVYVIRDAAPK